MKKLNDNIDIKKFPWILMNSWKQKIIAKQN